VATLLNHPHLELLATSALAPNLKNPRTHSDKQISQLAASIQRFGFVAPIIVDEDNAIVAGNARWQAAIKLGYEDVPVIRVAFLTEADRRAFILAENRLAELAGWDQERLNAELQFLFEMDFDLTVTGFELKDLDFTIEEQPTDEESVELPAADAVPVSRLGDLWSVGEHRIYCGNSRDAASFEVLLGEDRASMIFSDPPYNVPIAGHVSGLGKVQHREFIEATGELSASEFTAFLRSGFRNCVRFSNDGSIHFVCMDWSHMREILDAADGVYSKLKQLIVWNKSNAGMGSCYRQKYELIFMFKAGSGPHTNNFGLGETGRYRTNVWDYPSCNTFRKGRDADLEAHPTVKPLALVMDAILDCSHRGDIILDPYSGSATTLIAAHKTRRRGAAIELDPLYVDAGVERLCKVSALPATLADGRTFDEVAAERVGEQDV